MTHGEADAAKPVPDGATAAAQAWTSHLAAHPDTGARLIDGQAQRGLIEEGELLCRVARPVFVDTATFAAHRHLAEELVGALHRARDHLVANRRRLPHLGQYRPWVDELLGLEVADVDHGDVIRLDAFAGNGLHFVEANCDVPGGTGHADGIAEVFESLPFWDAMVDDHGAHMVRLQPLFLNTMLESWRAWGGEGSPSVALVGWPNTSQVMEAIFNEFLSYATEQGIDVRRAAPDELAWDSPRLLAAGEPCDLVFRAMLIRDVIERMDELAPLITALRNGAICMLNSFRSELTGHKALFALITDPAVDLGLTATQRAVVDRHVPWGRLVTDTATTGPDGTEIELLSWLENHGDDLVLKPTHAASGAGVVLGWDTDATGWRNAIEGALDGDHVVQQRVTLPRRYYPLTAPNHPEVEFVEDTDPFVFSGRVGSFLSRLSTDDITNVSAGGSLAPTVIVD